MGAGSGLWELTNWSRLDFSLGGWGGRGLNETVLRERVNKGAAVNK